MTDYDVGYKKPPRHSQFKPGNRANPHGRGKRERRNEAEIVIEIMAQSISFHEGGKLKRASRIELIETWFPQSFPSSRNSARVYNPF